MEIKTTEEIIEKYAEEFSDYYETYKADHPDSNKKWVMVDSLLNEINEAINNGNIELPKGVQGFSSALFLRKLIRELSGLEKKNDNI